MRNVAIIEDQEQALNVLKEYLVRYGEAFGEEFNVFHYPNSLGFLENYKGKFDVVFLDIMLPDLNGMELARRLRVQDKTVAIIFVTNMAQFAVNGYEVGASDFIVKPVSYADFSIKLKRTLEQLDGKQEKKVLITTKNVTLVFGVSDVKWLEVVLHKLIYHTTQGEAEAYGSLKKAEGILLEENFLRANKSVLVNPRYIVSVNGDEVLIQGGETIYLSRKYKKSFTSQFENYFGGKVQ